MRKYGRKNDTTADQDPLEDILKDVADEREKMLLTKVWNTLGSLVGAQHAPPAPSKELAIIFQGNDGTSLADGQMTDDELHMVAAAGVQRAESDDPAHLIGGMGNDYQFGGGGDDTLEAFGGNDYMVGGAGNDFMDGGDGNNRISGGDGNDTLIGGSGNDLLAGGSGGDVFVFNASSGNDTITDFNPLEDRLDFQGAGSDGVTMEYKDGNTIITFGDSTITVQGVNLLEDTDPDRGTNW